ncbi:MAG: coenzyme F420-0:L-glutamate ligase [Chloroflexota bacterium]
MRYNWSMVATRPCVYISLVLLVWLACACQPESLAVTVPTQAATAVPLQLSIAAIHQPLPATNTPALSPTRHQPTPTLPVTYTPEPTASPRPTQRFFEPLEMTPSGTAVPPPRQPFPKSSAVTNIVLLGNDVDQVQGGRTDSIIVISINRDAKTAAMLSLPRDLYVVIPGWQMTKINLALPHGHGVEYANSGGGGLIKDTIEYNLGIPVDYYARIGFDGFKQVVDTLGGVEIISNCKLRDWRLISPELDQTIEENWEQFTLEPGVHQMDGDLALWYARSRRTTNDFERGRRQQQVLRAIFNKGLERDTLADIPDLWRTYRQSVETDLTLPVILELAAMTEKDARVVELILRESNDVLRARPGAIIVEHRLGFVCANAGIDHSNVSPLKPSEGFEDFQKGNPEDWVLLLPEDPDCSAAMIRQTLETETGAKIGVLIIDSHGRAWRNGTAGAAIGLSGLPGLVDLRGHPDLFGFRLRITQVGAADELAAAASLVMGQAAEGKPVVHVRGFPYPLREGSLNELLRPKDQDLFR